MTSRERVKKVFNFEEPDRVPVYDLVGHGVYPEDDFDIALLDHTDTEESRSKNKFRMLAAIDPFEDLSCTFGLEGLLEKIAKDPVSVFNEFKRSTRKTLKRLEVALGRGSDIDGIWLWSDMAYKKGLFFSSAFYEDFLFPLHKEICSFSASKGLPVIIHSDGNLNSIISLLIEAGFSGLHPVESSAGMDLEELKNKYKNKMVFLGNFQLDLLRYDNIEEVLSTFKRKLDIAREGSGYIFGFESPIGEDIDINRYKTLLNIVKEYKGNLKPVTSNQSSEYAKDKNYIG